jgi:hypothetical protein
MRTSGKLVAIYMALSAVFVAFAVAAIFWL